MARKKKGRKPSSTKWKLVKASTAGLSILSRLSFYVLLASFCLAAVVMGYPEYLKMKELEGKLERTLEREERALALKDAGQRELDGLRYDPAYRELKARDRLNLYREGETVIRIRRQKTSNFAPNDFWHEENL